jgi:hypothetical protein
MQDEPFRPLGNVDGARVGLQLAGVGQEILIEQSGGGRCLATLLDPEVQPDRHPAVQIGGARYWRLSHNAQVDQRLKEIADLLILIRYLHPTFVQLYLELAEHA